MQLTEHTISMPRGGSVTFTYAGSLVRDSDITRPRTPVSRCSFCRALIEAEEVQWHADWHEALYQSIESAAVFK